MTKCYSDRKEEIVVRLTKNLLSEDNFLPDRYEVKVVYEPPITKVSPTFKPDQSVDNAINTLNEQYSMYVEGDVVDNRYDPRETELNDLQIVADQMIIGLPLKPMATASVRQIEDPTGNYRRLRISTYAAAPRPRTQRQLLISSTTCNCCAPQESVSMDVNAVALIYVRRFVRMFLVPEAEDICAYYREQPLDITPALVRRWANEHPLEKLQRVADLDNPLDDEELNFYKLLMKTDTKPSLVGADSECKVAVPQTIVHHTAKKSVLYSAFFTEFAMRIFSLLKPQYAVHFKANVDKTERFLNTIVGDDATIRPLELDASKFDKSQCDLVYAMEKILFKMFGMDESRVNAWINAHGFTMANGFDKALRLFIWYQ